LIEDFQLPIEDLKSKIPKLIEDFQLPIEDLKSKIPYDVAAKKQFDDWQVQD